MLVSGALVFSKTRRAFNTTTTTHSLPLSSDEKLADRHGKAGRARLSSGSSSPGGLQRYEYRLVEGDADSQQHASSRPKQTASDGGRGEKAQAGKARTRGESECVREEEGEEGEGEATDNACRLVRMNKTLTRGRQTRRLLEASDGAGDQ